MLTGGLKAVESQAEDGDGERPKQARAQGLRKTMSDTKTPPRPHRSGMKPEGLGCTSLMMMY